ncbi:MAG: DUF3422 domain-containing protein [Pseudomonadota bacterium]
MPPIEDHPLRYTLANELHARPFPSLEAPSTIAFLVLKKNENAAGRDRALDMAHLIDLLDRHGASHPQPGATHYSGQVGRHHLTWESHAEFVTYSAIAEANGGRPFDPADFEVFPDDWLGTAPGSRVTSALLRVEPRKNDRQLEKNIADWFVSESVAVARVVENSAVIAGDFRIDPAGHQRFLISVDEDIGARRAGRVMQRLCEIETYKAMSMLGFSRVRAMETDMGTMEDRLSRIIGGLGAGEDKAEDTLRELLDITAEMEALNAKSSFRFGATAAYQQIVSQRISVLREDRFGSRQTFSEFMMRRYDPAMRTVTAAKERLDAMVERARRAGELLRTRVDVERSAQNQALLESMDRRAALQLRLQRTVEGLSVVAISYYAVSLASYLLYPVSEATEISTGVLTAAVTLPVVLVVWWLVRKLRESVT